MTEAAAGEQDADPVAGGSTESPTEVGNPPINYNERVLLVGKTQSGKSTFARRIFGSMTGCQRILVDPKGQENLGVDPVRSVAAIDWRAPIIHFIPQRLDRDEYEELFSAIWNHASAVQWPVYVWLDEAMSPTTKSYAPWGLRMIATQGASHGTGLLAVSQRPVDIHPCLRTEAEHLIAFVPRPHPLNTKALAEAMNLPESELERRFDDLAASEGDHSFLWYSIASHQLLDCAPIPVS